MHGRRQVLVILSCFLLGYHSCLIKNSSFLLILLNIIYYVCIILIILNSTVIISYITFLCFRPQNTQNWMIVILIGLVQTLRFFFLMIHCMLRASANPWKMWWIRAVQEASSECKMCYFIFANTKLIHSK